MINFKIKNKMMNRKRIGFFAYVLLVAGLIGCQNRSDEKTCIVGQKYIKRFIWDEGNPFEKAKYVTVIVIDVQNGYVKYKDVNNKDTSFFLSGKVKYFLEDSKPCH